MRSITRLLLFSLVLGWILAGISPVSAGNDVPRMTKEALKEQLGNPQVVIIDVRQGHDWRSSEFKIQGAVRQVPADFDNWSDTYPKGKTLVLY